MQLVAVLIAAAFALIGLLPLVRTHLRHPTLWMMVGVGVFAFPITQWVSRRAWEPLAFTFGISQTGVGLAVNFLVWALLAELFKFAPVLIVGAMTEAPPEDWFAYGAGAGAGFGVFGAQLVIGLALAASRLPFSTPLSTGLAIALRLFPVLTHIATTAFVSWSATRGWLGIGFLLAVGAQATLGLIERGQPALGTVGTLLSALITLFLFLYVWTLRDRTVPARSRLQVE